MENYTKEKVVSLLNFMYGKPVGDAIGSMKLNFSYSSHTHRLKSVCIGTKLLAVVRSDGYILLQHQGLKLFSNCADLQKKVIVADEAKPFVLQGKDVFAPFISNFVGQHYAGEDSIICSKEMEPLGCGQLLLLPSETNFLRGA